MSLSCSSGEWEPEPGQTAWWEPNSFTTYQGKRRVKCKSCGKMIDNGSLCLEWARFKVPEHEVEVKVYGEDGEIPRASWFWCEPCGDQFFNLKELGFCPQADDEVSELLREYHEEYVVPEHGQMINAVLQPNSAVTGGTAGGTAGLDGFYGGEMIAKYRKDGFPGEWHLTDFTMQQVEGRITDLERDLQAARDALNLVQRGGLQVAVESLGAEMAQANERFGHLTAVMKLVVNGSR